VAGQVAGADEALAQGEQGLGGPGALSFARVPERREEGFQRLPVALLAEQGDELVELGELDLRQVDLLVFADC
jgi:hypothetical protein